MFDLQAIRRAGFEQVLEQMPTAVMIVEAPSGNIVFVNRRARQMAEQTLAGSVTLDLRNLRDLQDMDEQSISRLSHPDGRPYELEEWPLMRSIRSGEEVRGEEYFHILADGTRISFCCDSSPIYDDEGRIVAGVIVFHDITDRKLKEEQLARYAYLEENAHDAFIAMDEQLRVKAWNRGAERMYGVTSNEALGRDAREVVSLEMSDEQLSDALQEIEQTGQLRVEQVQHRKDGTSIHIDSLTIAMRDERGEITGYLAINRDITEREQADEELRESSRRMENILESITEDFYTVDHEWRFTYLNQRALDIIRRARGEELMREELLGRNVWECFPELVGTVFYDKYHEAMREQKTVEIEGYSPLRDRWAEVHAYPSEEGLSVYILDITERKLAEEQLAYQAHLLENVHDAVIGMDEQLLITAWNKGAQEMYGWRADEVLGRNLWEVVPTEMSQEERGEAMRELSERERFRIEVITYGKDGTPVYVEEITIALREEQQGEITGYVNIRRDITERKRFEDEQQRLVSIVQNSSDFIGIADLDWRPTFLNEAGQRLVGLNNIEEVRRTDVLDYFMPEDSAFVKKTLVPEILEEGQWRGELNLRHFQTGEPIPVLWDAFRIDDPRTGEPIGLATVTRDLTETKRAEKALIEAREAERSRIARDLHDEALQHLAGAMAHAQLARANSQGVADRIGQLSEALKRVEQQLHAAVYDLRLGGEQDRPFTELLESLVELHRSMASESVISLDVGDGILSEPLGETGRELLRILGEALANARRHSRARDVKVSVWTSDEARLYAEVSDDGRGFDPARIAPATAAGGVGLQGMRERARAIGGTLRIESEPAMGTRVRFELDLRQDPGEAEEVVRTLLVEDHDVVREALASAFEREEGFDIVGQAGSLAEARRLLEESGPIDVAVVDLGLPDGYGGDLIKDLHETNPQAQALVLTASRDRAGIARAVERGAAGILNKTTHLDEVAEAVRRLRAGETLMPLEEVVELLRFAGSRREEEYDAHQAITQLTPREIEVLQALAEGLDSEEIAGRLHISLRTERNHMSNILTKLGVHSQLEALVFAVRHGVVEIR